MTLNLIEGNEMKTFTNKTELKNLNACEDGYKTFIETHGDNDAKLSQYLESNGWGDVWWLISESYDQFSEGQKKDLILLGCEYALSCIESFGEEFPEDKRPRLAIEASISFANGEITKEELNSARSAAWSAARSAAWSAAESARSAAWAAWSKNKKMLMDLFLKWEYSARTSQ